MCHAITIKRSNSYNKTNSENGKSKNVFSYVTFVNFKYIFALGIRDGHFVIKFKHFQVTQVDFSCKFLDRKKEYDL